MRRLFLIRHGLPAFPEAEKMCIGSTDLPLSPTGRFQACLLAETLRGISFGGVFCSRLERSRRTAEFLDPEPICLPGLEEMHAGDWDGLTFRQIRQRWPALFALRGRDPSAAIPGSEPLERGGARFLTAVEQALSLREGDIAIVAHATVNRSLICHALGLPPAQGRRFPLDYCAYCVFEYEGGSFSLRPEDINLPARPPLTDALCRDLLEAAGLPENTRQHCEAVSREAVRIGAALNEAGLGLDLPLIRRAGLLHDIGRGGASHEALGAAWIRALGYEREADIIARHHELGSLAPDEAAAVYLADKTVKEDLIIPLEARFAASLEKCSGGEARTAWQRRLGEALRLRDMINKICGKEIIA